MYLPYWSYSGCGFCRTWKPQLEEKPPPGVPGWSPNSEQEAISRTKGRVLLAWRNTHRSEDDPLVTAKSWGCSCRTVWSLDPNPLWEAVESFPNQSFLFCLKP